ncbi:MAG: hypothetical protein ACTSWR_11535 [Candidatus Helarchaeota archaeon]
MNRRFKYFDFENSLKVMKGEIDLQFELKKLFEHEKRSKWFIYRRKDLSKRREGFLDFMNENPDGPNFVYQDELHRGFKIPMGSMSLIRRTEPNYTFGAPFQQFTYFVFQCQSEYHGRIYYLNPKPEDLIFEIDYHKDLVPDIVEKVYENADMGRIVPPFFKCFNIKNIIDLSLDDNHRLEYYILACVANPISNK